MSRLKQLIHEIHRRSLWQVLGIYIGVSWIVLQVIEVLSYLFDPLPPVVWSSEHARMRRDPRFVEFLERQAVVDLWREIGPPPDCIEEGDTFRCGLLDRGAD